MDPEVAQELAEWLESNGVEECRITSRQGSRSPNGCAVELWFDGSHYFTIKEAERTPDEDALVL